MYEPCSGMLCIPSLFFGPCYIANLGGELKAPSVFNRNMYVVYIHADITLVAHLNHRKSSFECTQSQGTVFCRCLDQISKWLMQSRKVEQDSEPTSLPQWCHCLCSCAPGQSFLTSLTQSAVREQHLMWEPQATTFFFCVFSFPVQPIGDAVSHAWALQGAESFLKCLRIHHDCPQLRSMGKSYRGKVF